MQMQGPVGTVSGEIFIILSFGGGRGEGGRREKKRIKKMMYFESFEAGQKGGRGEMNIHFIFSFFFFFNLPISPFSNLSIHSLIFSIRLAPKRVCWNH